MMAFPTRQEEQLMFLKKTVDLMEETQAAIKKIVDLTEETQAATSLVELRDIGATSGVGFNHFFLNVFGVKACLYNFEGNRFLLKRFMSIILMVVSFLDLGEECNYKLLRQSTKKGFVRHMERWYYEVESQNVRKKTESYLFEEADLISNVSIIDASRDAQGFIGVIMNYVKKNTTDFTKNEYLDPKFHREMRSILICSFRHTNSYVPEFGTFFELIISMIITRMSFLSFLAMSCPVVNQKKCGRVWG